MKKYIHIVLKVVLSLFLLMPILGVTGIFPEPTRDMYTNDLAFAFIDILTQVGYMMVLMAIVNLLALIALWSKREALAALLILPITVCIIGFHTFVDGGLFAGSAVMGVVLFVINLYLLYRNRTAYQPLFSRR